MEEELMLLGLNKTDVRVYLSMLELGEALASKIAEKSKVPRASIYDVLERLIKEGLASYVVKEHNKYFSAAEPKVVVVNLEYKRERIKDILPALEEIKKKKSEEKTKTEIYEGKAGAQAVLNMMLEEKEILALGGSRKTSEILPYFMPKWNKERRKRRINVKMIYNDSPEIRKQVKLAEKDQMPIRYKFLHTDYFSPILTMIFGNRVMLGNWHKEPNIILIKDREITETYKQYFENLWKIAKK